MAREFGQIDSAAWRDDDDWRSLPADGQWLYGLLISQSDLTAAGVLNVATNRWRHMCSDMTEERFTEALTVLEERRFIIVDLDTEELLVRSFARRKTQWANSKRVGALRSAVAQMHSSLLRQALANELARVAKTVDGLPVPTTDPLTEGLTEPSAEPEPIRLADVSSSTCRELPPQTGDERQETGDASAKPRPQKRATGAPDLLPVTDGMRKFVSTRGIPSEVARHETQRFLDFHRAKGNTFKDWEAAWRTWMGKVAIDHGNSRPGGGSGDRDVIGVGGLSLDVSMQ